MNLLGISLVCVVADILSVYFDFHSNVPMAVRYITHTVYLVIHSLMPALYVIYIMILTDTDYRMKGLTRVLFIIPFSVVSVISILNFFTGWLFYFDENLVYTRGILFPVLYVSAILYILHIVSLMIRFGLSLGKMSFIAIGGIVPMMVVAALVQFLYPNLLFEMFANSLSMLLVSTLINRPEDLLDTESGLSNRKACTETLKRCLKNEKPLELILVNITNFRFVEGIVGYEGMLKLLRKVSGRVVGINRIHRVFSELFYMGDGKFCFEMNYRRFDKTTYIAHYLNEILSTPISYASMEINLNAVICITRCPEDITDVESVMAFQDDLNSKFYNGEVLFASEVYSGYHYSLMRQIDSIIENALTNRLFEVYYQPIYSIHEDKFNSAEALVRLKDENYGFISPEFFIPAAEKSGAIHRLGAYVLEEVCKFIGSSDFMGLGVDYIEVNLSAAQCMRNDLHKEV
jgi:predicted signal transduction protein with EAL and GGDEF domain